MCKLVFKSQIYLHPILNIGNCSLQCYINTGRHVFLFCFSSDVACRSGPSSMIELQRHDEEDDDIGESMYLFNLFDNF